MTAEISPATTYVSAAAKAPTKIVNKVIKGSKVVVTIQVRINKGNNTKSTFTDKVGEALKFLQGVCADPEVALLPLNHQGDVFKSTKSIKTKKDMPKYVVEMRQFL